MPARTFQWTALTQLLLGIFLGGCAVLFGACVLIGHAQAQSGSSGSSTSSPSTSSAPSTPSAPPPTTPTQSPTVNPSTRNTVQQPSSRSVSPSTPSTTPSTPSATSSTPGSAPTGEATSRANDETPSTTARSERAASRTKNRSVHYRHHRYSSRPDIYACSHLGCVRTYAWAFPCQYYSRYCTVAAPWWPGFYDYAPGQFGRAAYLGRGHRAGYWGD